jgi:hypothetical protein
VGVLIILKVPDTIFAMLFLSKPPENIRGPR